MTEGLATTLDQTAAYAEARLPQPRFVTQHATPAGAFEAARRTYLAGERVDMRALAQELGVARTTLYRWTGGRERLLTDVIWALSEDLIDHLWAGGADLKGADRVIATCHAYADTIARSRALRSFVASETSTALRLLTVRGGFQDRLVDRVAALLREEEARGTLTLRSDPHALAYAIVRLIEGFTYNDAMFALEPRLDEAMPIVRLLLE